jgi:hypothetical protein
MRLISFQLTGSITLTLADSEFNTKIGAAIAGKVGKVRPAPSTTSWHRRRPRPRRAKETRWTLREKITKEASVRQA